MLSRRIPSPRRLVLGATLFLAAVGATASAHAQTQPISRETRALADEHIRIGVADFNARLFTQAAQEFEVAYQLNHDPLLLSNIGNARYEAGELAAARDAFREFLARVPNPPNRVVIEQRLQRVNDMLDAERRRNEAPVSSAPPSSTPPPAIVPDAPRSRGLTSARIAGIAIGAVGVVSVGIGAGLYASVDAFYRDCERNLPAGCAVSTQPRGLDAAAVALLWGGAVAAVGGTLLAILAPRPHVDDSTARAPRRFRIVDMAFDPRGGLSMRGEF